MQLLTIGHTLRQSSDLDSRQTDRQTDNQTTTTKRVHSTWSLHNIRQ